MYLKGLIQPQLINSQEDCHASTGSASEFNDAADSQVV
jgi:hypothetical protein